MGVADNKTYRDTYHFKNTYYNMNIDEVPSVNGEASINTTIGDNPYRANVEIEKGEIVLQPDLTALFKARGKKHSGGGIDVNLKPDAFIFSDDKTLALTKEECQTFEFEPYNKKGSHKAKDYTPAKVLKKQIDIEHYNRIVNNLDDPNKDDLAKKSSLMMLEKYINTLGNIAYVQEAKKDFPTGIPEFAINTAPVYNTELKDEIMEQKQYAKYGGSVMQRGGKIPQGPMIYDTKGWTKIGETEQYIQYQNAAGEVKQVPKNNGPKMSDADWTKFINSPQGRATRHLRQPQTISATRYGYQGKPIPTIEPTRGSLPEGIIPRAPMNFSVPPPAGQDVIDPGDVTGEQQGRKDANWDFTPWQKMSQLYNLGKYASLKRYMPYRSHLNPSYVDPQLVNPEQAMGAVRSIANQQTSSLNTLNPILRNAQAASIYGQMIGKIPEIQSQYDNQNAGISNQFRGMNNQIANNARATNMQNDQQYYKESVVGRQNFDNAKTFAADQYMNNLLRDVETNQSLAYNMMTVNNPAYGFDFKKGNFYRNPMDLRDVQGSSSSSTIDAMGAEAKKLHDMGLPPAVISAILRSRAFSQMAPYLGQSPTFAELTGTRQQKKGGRVNPYRR